MMAPFPSASTKNMQLEIEVGMREDQWGCTGDNWIAEGSSCLNGQISRVDCDVSVSCALGNQRQYDAAALAVSIAVAVASIHQLVVDV